MLQGAAVRCSSFKQPLSIIVSSKPSFVALRMRSIKEGGEAGHVLGRLCEEDEDGEGNVTSIAKSGTPPAAVENEHDKKKEKLNDVYEQEDVRALRISSAATIWTRPRETRMCMQRDWLGW
mmetsp:Transcript_72847/g.152112  ORF Transcript_72847/g.152112 Transcript_72847/m.152112 type:complete len:121 (+) Transcript_72847:633-995(+)